MVDRPLLSVVLTSYTTERLRDVFELLDSIKAQTYPNFETIFVAERSRELYEQVKAYAGENGIPNLKVIFNEGTPGASAARNLGIERAAGDIIAFLDDDTLPFSDWVDEMVKTYQDNTIIGVTGPALPLWEDPEMSWFPEEFHWIISCTSWFKCNGIEEVRNVWTENASFTKEAFEVAGLFATQIGPREGSMSGRKTEISEDVEVSLRVREKTKKRIVYNPRVKVWHRVPKERLRWGYIIQWSYWMGLSKRKLKKLYTEVDIGINPIGQEHGLLRRIFTSLFPNILKGVPKDFVVAWRKLLVTLVVLFFVTLGYNSHLLNPFRSLKQIAQRS